ncbi:MAG TPA: tRNA epoxyqueuosine(34) reductase QueG [Desulfitobacteriaceae bacterium]|jgi:epoxyqueuosine reductase|nr:tRNA epoxyqueuosine(34) reductase QueG [Desulfitobacteriaceae bacterium]
MSKPVWAEQEKWKENICHWSGELGFAAVGFTKAQRNYELEAFLKERQANNFNTPWETSNHRLRCDPQAVWNKCQTVVVLAHPLPLSSPVQKNEGILARSAVGEDYHLTVGNKLELLSERIMGNGWKSLPPRIQVDKGPLNERALAYQAGIGWLGCNQQLIVPEFGSFVSLGLLLLDQSLPADKPISGQCGACKKCIEACPAQILGKTGFAAPKCLSYLTQSKEVLASAQIDTLGGRIFGCDTCQEVCPYNEPHKIKENEITKPLTEGSSFSKNEDLNPSLHRGVDLLKVLNLTKSEFNSCYRATAAGWRGKSILQRNAFLALMKADDGSLRKWLSEREDQQGFPAIIRPYLIHFAKQ